MRRLVRIAAVVCALVMVLVVFQSRDVRANPPSGANEYNHALATYGGVASSSGSSGNYVPGNTIDGNMATSWQSSTTTGWLAVAFSPRAYVNEIHIHFLTKVYPSLSLYLDTNANGLYDTGEKVKSLTNNAVLNVVIDVPQAYALGMKVTIDAKVGSSHPQIAEFEAYLVNDSDGDGLTNNQETSTVYYQDMTPSGLPAAIPNDAVNISQSSVSLAQFYGLSSAALANFTVDDSQKSELTASVGYWNGTAWIDKWVWDPGWRTLGVHILQPPANGQFGGTVPVVASVDHPEYTSKVELRINGALQSPTCVPAGNQCTWNVNTIPWGDAQLTLNVTQYDTLGAKAWAQSTILVDNLPPTVDWRFGPAPGSVLKGMYTFQVYAADFSGVSGVDFQVDGMTVGAMFRPYPATNPTLWWFPWDTSMMLDGSHTLTARAYDGSWFHRTASANLAIVTRNELGIQITRPDSVNYYTGAVTATAYVTHPEITARVEFRVDGLLKATVTTPTDHNYSWSWDTSTYAEGIRSLNVTQYDSVGAGAWAQIQVKVDRPPAMTWVAPANNALVSGLVSVRVTAADWLGVEWVDFYVDNMYKYRVLVPNDGLNGYLWSWDTSQYCTNTQHTLKAIATENPPLYLTTALSVTVTGNQPLRVCITFPANGAYVSGTTSFRADAATPSGTTITKVDFYISASYWSTSYSAPYTSDAWDTTAAGDGAYTITAIATNSVGNTASSSITIHVNNGSGGGGCTKPPCPASPTPAPAAPVGTPSNALGTLASEWKLGEVDAGTKATVVVDLASPQSGATPAENAARILRPAFPLSYFTTYLQWRLVIKDWTIGGSGTVTAFTLRFEVKSDPNNADTDGDGIPDGVEVYTYHTLPVSRDSDLDGLGDYYEITPHSETVTANGVTTILAPFKTDPTKWDTDGDGLSDGQERGFVSFGMTKTIGEVGTLPAVSTSGWTTVYLHNHYTAPVVLAEPASYNNGMMIHARIGQVTDHTFQVKLENWASGTCSGTGPGCAPRPETLSYLVIESGDFILPDGSQVEAGTATGVSLTPVTVTFRESFGASAPIVLIQTQTTSDPTPVVANRTYLNWTGSFGVRLNANASTSHNPETVGYVAIAAQTDLKALSTWTRAEASFKSSESTGAWTFPAKFAQTQAPLVLAWMGPEAAGGTKNLGIRLKSASNASATVYREQSGAATADKVDFFAFAGPMNLTARMTTKANGTGSTDTDGDSLSDGVEVSTYGSNPALKDTDADGIPDNTEVTPRSMTIPINGTLKTISFTTSPTSSDTDADGIPDLQEIQGILDHRVLHYDMSTRTQGSSGPVQDLSGNGNDGAVTGTTPATGKLGGALKFSSSSDSVVVSSPVALPVSSVSISVWANIASKPTSGNFFDFVVHNWVATGGWIIYVDSTGKVYAGIADGTGQYTVASTSAPTLGAWHQYAMTYDGSVVFFYIDGVSQGTVTHAVALNTNAYVDVGWTAGTGAVATVTLDDVQVWDRALSKGEVTGMYNITSAASYVARLDFETPASAGVLFDFSGTGHTGALTGTSVVDGRTGFARKFAAGTDGIVLSNSATLAITSGVTLDVHLNLASLPASDVSLVARKGSFYLNVSSDGLVHWTLYGKGAIATSVPIALGRWVRVTATATTSTLNLYLDGATAASGTASAFPSTTNGITLGYTEGQTHLLGSLDEFTLLSSAASAWTIANTGAGGIQLNPASPDTDGDGLSDGQETVAMTFGTTLRYPIKDLQTVATDTFALAIGAPASFIVSATAMVGITHTFMGDLVITAVHQGLASYTLRNRQGGSGHNNFTSFDMFNAPFQIGRKDLASSAPWYLQVSDQAGGDIGQIEYFKIEIVVHMLPNRADTDRDGLNDSEEVNLGRDGYSTNPWMADTDTDGVSDGLEVNGWSWSQGAIVSNPSGFKTDPTRRDTDRDGVVDGQDRVPTGDAFVDVLVYTITPAGTGASDGDATLHPFASMTVGGQTAYTSWKSVSPGTAAYILEDYVVNVDDTSPNVSITIQAWDYDTRIENGNHDDVHTSLAVATDTSYGGCSGVTTWSFQYGLGIPGGMYSEFSSSGYCAGSSRLRADPIVIHVSTVIPERILSYMITPADYNGLYNITNSAGTIISRRYTGEQQFVALALNVTSIDRYGAHHDPYVYLVPRSVFFDSMLYKDLSTSNLVDPLGSLSFASNSTTSTKNSDAVQQVLTGNVTEAQMNTIVALLQQNLTGATAHGKVFVSPDFYSDGLFLYSLPDDVIRVVAYYPTYSYASSIYRFCSTPNCQAPQTQLSIWAQIWLGIVNTVTNWIASAVVLAVTAFKVMVQVFTQIAAWVWNNVIQPVAAAVKSAVQAAAKVLSMVVDWAIGVVRSIVQGLLDPIISLIRVAIDDFRSHVAEALQAAFVHHSPSEAEVDPVASANRLYQALTASVFFVLLGLVVSIFEIAELLTKPVSIFIAAAVAVVGGVIASYLVSTLISQAPTTGSETVTNGPEDGLSARIVEIVPDSVWQDTRTVWILTSIGIALFAKFLLSTIVETNLARSAQLAVASFFLWDFGLIIPALGPYAGLIAAIIGLGLASVSFLLAMKATAERAVAPITWTVLSIMSLFSVIFSLGNLDRAIYKLSAH